MLGPASSAARQPRCLIGAMTDDTAAVEIVSSLLRCTAAALQRRSFDTRASPRPALAPEVQKRTTASGVA